MTRIRDLPPAWTARRIALWSIVGAVALMVVSAAAGYLATHLDRAGGDRVWVERLRWVVTALPILVLTGVGVVMWRHSRRRERMTSGGEARAIRRSRGFWTVLGVQLIAGMATGAIGGYDLFHPERVPEGIGAWLTLAMAVLFVVATVWGCVALYPRMDELELQDNLWGSAAGAGALMLIYPAWYMLWRGRWVTEPSHEALFLLLFVVAMATYGWRKSRR